MNTRIVIALICALLVFQSCVFVRFSPKNHVVPSSELVSDTLELEEFSSIVVSGFFDVEYCQVPSGFRAELTLPKNVCDIVSLHVENGRLNVCMKSDIHLISREGMKIKLISSLPLEEVQINGSGSFKSEELCSESGLSLMVMGSGDIEVDNIMTSKLSIAIAGSGDVEIDNAEVSDFSAAIAGSGDIKARGKAVNASLAIAGSGDIDVKYLEVSGVFNSEVKGSGSIIRK